MNQEFDTMKLSPIAVLCSTLLLTACATQQPSPPKVSDREINEFLARHEALTEEDRSQWDQMILARDDAPVAWVQPANKTNACKVYVTHPDRWWEAEDAKIFWDGDCRDGYAVGLGREFAETPDDGLGSWLANYEGEDQEPTYYLAALYDQERLTLMSDLDGGRGTLTYRKDRSSAESQFFVERILLDQRGERFYAQVTPIGGDQRRSMVRLPNRRGYAFVEFISPASDVEFTAYSADESGQWKGYGITRYRQGVTHHFRSSQPMQHDSVSLPQSYLNHLLAQGQTMDEQHQRLNIALQENYSAINRYKRRICNGQVSVDFIDDQIYGRICLEHGELSPYQDLIAELEAEQQRRHQEAHKQLLAQQELAARRQTEYARAAAEQAQARASAIDQFANSMEAFRRNAEQMSNGYIQPNVQPQPSFGPSPTQQTNCVVISNIVHCRSQ